MAAGLEVKGAPALRRTLKQAGDGLPKELAKIHRAVAQMVQPLAQAQAQSMGGMQAHFASKIRARASQREANLAVLPIANAAFWGAKEHTGWYAGKPGPAQFPAWVGANWEPGVAGQGPYALNDAVARALPQVLAVYKQSIDDLLSRV